jgi:hypothetical protein
MTVYYSNTFVNPLMHIGNHVYSLVHSAQTVNNRRGLNFVMGIFR